MKPNTSVWIIILGMSIVTYLPRVLPVFILDKIKLSSKFEDVLSAIPYATLGSLLFPGILSVDQNLPLVGLLGGAIALLLSYLKLNMTTIICGSVIGVILLKLLIA